MTVVYVPIAYDLTYTAVRGTKPRTETVRDNAPAIIADVDAKDAPVAVRATIDDGRAIEYRWFEGMLWEPAGELEVTVDKPKKIDFEKSFLVPKSSPLRTDAKIQAVAEVIVNPKKPSSSNRERIEAALQDEANGMRMIGGVPYRQSIGPVIQLRLASGAREGTLVLVHMDDRSDDLIDSMIFRADQRDLAIETTRSLFKKAPPVNFEQPEILIPEALKADMDQIAIVRMGERVFLRDVDKVGIGNLPNDFLTLYLEYTEPTFDRSGVSPELVRMIGTGGELLKEVRECGTVSKAAGWLPKRQSTLVQEPAVPVPSA